MSKNNVVELTGRDTIIDPLTDLLRTGTEQLICQAGEPTLFQALRPDTVTGAAKIQHFHLWTLTI